MSSQKEIDYQIELRKNRRLWATNYLGGQCAVCASTDQLEFDHVDKTTKNFTIASRLTIAEDALTLELDKCQLLCKDCHNKKSKLEKQNTMKSNKLDWDTVEDIKGLLTLGIKQTIIAEMYGVTRSTIHLIKKGEIWNP